MIPRFADPLTGRSTMQAGRGICGPAEAASSMLHAGCLGISEQGGISAFLGSDLAVPDVP